ncbi:hypothetical protein, partial [Bacteroides acidifaciens]|uniref:hypothetical protein n=1 Tax=Bacteroides acidifaciens TaxID=85831 RepID=UPI00301484EA
KVSLKTGKPTGRPAIGYPRDWPEVYARWKNKEITAVEARQLLGLKTTTFYKLARQYETDQPPADSM